MAKREKQPFIWVAHGKFLVVTPKEVWLASKQDVMELLEGKRDKVPVQKIRRDTIVSLKMKKPMVSFRALVPVEARITDAKLLKQMESQGIIPVQRELGETTRKLDLRLDTRNMNRLRLVQLKLSEKDGVKHSLSYMLRLCILRGLEQLEKELMISQQA